MNEVLEIFDLLYSAAADSLSEDIRIQFAGVDCGPYKQLCNMYDVAGLREDAAVNMKKFITKDNVFDLLDFNKQHHVKDLKSCTDFIVNNFDMKQVKKDGTLIRHPEISVAMLNYKDARKYSVWDLGDCKTLKTDSWTSSKLSFKASEDIMLCGVGLSMVAGRVNELKAEIKIEVTQNDDILGFLHEETDKLLNDKTWKVFFTKPIRLTNGRDHTITWRLKGNSSEKLAKGIGGIRAKIPSIDSNGNQSKRVELKITGENNDAFTEMYYYVPLSN